MASRNLLLSLRLLLLAGCIFLAAKRPATAAEPWHTFALPSLFQEKMPKVRVLLPGDFDANKRYPVIYVLPILVDGDERAARFGDGLEEIEALDLNDIHDAIFVAPSFTRHPWYADHHTRVDIRQESHLLDVVVPFIDANYPVVPGREGRLLMGFSASGWGAAGLALRNPGVFARAAVWDAPLMQDTPRWSMLTVLGNRENFEHHRVDRSAAGQRGESDPLLILVGCQVFCDHHAKAHEHFLRYNIPHVFGRTPPTSHVWTSGWLSQAVAGLLDDTPDEASGYQTVSAAK